MKEHRQITEILDQVEEHLPVGSKIIVACSGGADSIALADALLLLQEKRKYQLVVCHVEHGLRGSEALADADFVVEFCRMRQVACEVLRVDAKKFAAESKLSVEDAARKLRYTVLFEILSKHKSEYIVTAHHRDDQAETLLLHLLRGSGAEGLGGMRCHNNSIVRPFLQVSRRMLEAYCAMRSLDYRTDSSNMDLYYTRNKVRHILLPLLERDFNALLNKASVYFAAQFTGDNPAVPNIVGIAADFKIQAGRAEILKQHIRRRIFQNIFAFGRTFKQNLFDLVNVRTISHADSDRLTRPVVAVRQVGYRIGNQSRIRNYDTGLLERFNFGRANVYLLNPAFLTVNDDPVADFERTLKQNDDAGNKVVNDVLQTETDTDGKSRSYQRQIGKVAAHDRYADDGGQNKADKAQSRGQ